MGILSSIIGGAGNYFAAKEQARAQEKAARMADQRFQEGRDYVTGQSDLSQIYAPGGAAAYKTQQGLLGIGGDPEASNEAFQNYLGSTGYRARLKGGTDAITAGAAATGGLDSGATRKRLMTYGSQLAGDEFNNYFNRVDSQAGRGQAASQDIANLYTGANANSAAALQSGYGDAADSRAAGGSNLANSIAYGVRSTWGG